MRSIRRQADRPAEATEGQFEQRFGFGDEVGFGRESHLQDGPLDASPELQFRQCDAHLVERRSLVAFVDTGVGGDEPDGQGTKQTLGGGHRAVELGGFGVGVGGVLERSARSGVAVVPSRRRVAARADSVASGASSDCLGGVGRLTGYDDDR